MFGVPIGNEIIIRKVQFHPAAPVIKYNKKTSNSCCLSSLASSFTCSDYNWAIPTLLNITKYSLTIQTENCKDIIHFANAILTNRKEEKKVNRT